MTDPDPDAAPAARLEGVVAQSDDPLLLLRLGAEVVARVAALGPDGRGVLSLAGALVRARLPEGVQEGDRLPLTVVGGAGEVVLRLRAEGPADSQQGAPSPGTARPQPDGGVTRPAGELDAYA